MPAQQPVVGLQHPIALLSQPVLIDAVARPREATPSEAPSTAPSAMDIDRRESRAAESDAVEVNLPEAKPPAPTESSLAVPEPSMLLAVGGGLVLIALAKRRRRGRSTPLLPR